MARLPLSGCSYGWLHQEPLETALRSLAEHDLTSLELTTAPPHVHSPGMTQGERSVLAKQLTGLGLSVVSTNPTFCDINLVSTNPDFRKLSEDQIRIELELASFLGAGIVVVIPGRLHTLAPAPADTVRSQLVESLRRLAERAAELGVTIGVENSPYGYLGASGDLVSVVDEIDHPRLGVVYDVANALANEDPASGLERVAHRLVMTHLSDTWRDRWAHTSPGRGEVDFAAFASALSRLGFEGPNVYELIDMEPPGPRLLRDIAVLEAAGFSRSGAVS